MPPAITVITPLLNRAAMLPEALTSLAAQKCGDVEHLVVDGGSTDGSQAVVTKAGATLIDAPGSSIYEAINLGVARAEGAMIWLLNSDDTLAPRALAASRALLERDESLDFVRGRARVARLTDAGEEEIDSGAYPDPAPELRTVLLAPSNINACLFRTASMKRFGPFDAKLTISADRAWLAQALVRGARTAGLDQVVYTYRAHGQSLTIGGRKAAAARWVREHLAFTRTLLQDAPSPDTRRDLRAFFGKETAHLAALGFGAGDVRQALSALAHGFSVDPLWPLHAAGPIADVVARRVRPR